ncbi:MAG: GlcG/HbpS family heme-binding protein [Alphaproteobacteria bacterium]
MSSANAAEDAPATYGFKTLSVELAAKAAHGAMIDCRNKGYSVAVAVVDRGGNLQAFFRDQLAGPHTPDTAIGKAWTANSFRQNTGDLAQFLIDGTIPSRIPDVPGALLVGGGKMIENGEGVLLGGIGVSGAPPGKSEQDSIDGACAQAGIDAIEEPLAFAE